MWNELKDNRIFVGGHRKGGTTLPIALLDNHPDLFVFPYGTHFWYSFYPVYAKGDYTTDEKIKRITDFIFPDIKQIFKKWMNFEEKDLNFSFKEWEDRYRSTIEQGPQTTKHYFDTFIRLVREILPCPNYDSHKIILTKDNHSEIHADVLFELYPDAKFIQIFRDPRDNAAVIMNGWEKHYHNNYDSKNRLFRDIIDRGWLCDQTGLDNMKKYGKDKYKFVKYEDIVTNTEDTMYDLAKFIGINPEKLQLTPSFCGVPWKGNSFTDKNYKGVNTERIGISDKYLSENQIKVVEYYFMDIMHELGYEPRFERTECLEAISRHYEWFNNNQIYSGKSYRKYED